MIIDNVTFTKFEKGCGNSINYAITNGATNDDGQHPVLTKNIKL
jgi:hypothetical protein